MLYMHSWCNLDLSRLLWWTLEPSHGLLGNNWSVNTRLTFFFFFAPNHQPVLVGSGFSLTLLGMNLLDQNVCHLFHTILFGSVWSSRSEKVRNAPKRGIVGEGWSRGKLVKVTRVLVGEGDHVSTVTSLVPCRGVRGPCSSAWAS